MKKRTSQYYALVKYEIHADDFVPAYQFVSFISSTPIQLAESIAREFVQRVDEAISCDDEPDEELKTDRKELNRRLKAFINNIKATKNVKHLEIFEDSITINYPTYEFTVLISNQEEMFYSKLLTVLGADEDFVDFIDLQIEDYDPDFTDDDSEHKHDLALDFQRLISCQPEELEKEDLRTFLKGVEEYVQNEDMG